MNAILQRAVFKQAAFRQASFKQAILATSLAAGIALGGGSSAGVHAQTLQSRLFDITKNKKLRVCQYPLYYSISYRDPSTGRLTGIDVDLSKELAKELGAELEVIESNFGTFIADLQTNKCEIGMFAIGATLKRAQAVEFSKPYLITSIYGVARKGGPIKAWTDIDKSGVKAAALLGSYIEGFMKDYLKKGEVVSVAPPNTREAELMAHRADVILTDYPTAIKVTKEFDWAETITPDEPLAVTPYAYVVPQGDQIWLNYVNLFVDTIKRDGRLKKFADKYQLGPIVAP